MHIWRAVVLAREILIWTWSVTVERWFTGSRRSKFPLEVRPASFERATSKMFVRGWKNKKKNNEEEASLWRFRFLSLEKREETNLSSLFSRLLTSTGRQCLELHPIYGSTIDRRSGAGGTVRLCLVRSAIFLFSKKVEPGKMGKVLFIFIYNV